MTGSIPTRNARPARQGLWLCLTLILAACAGSDATPSSREIPVFALSVEPTVEIGVLEGDPEYLFQDVASTLRLPSGDILVSDAGALEVSTYRDDGTFIRRWGGRGEGPGEFRGLSRIYAGDNGTIMALDAWTGRISVFDADGSYSRQLEAADLSGDTLFPLDVWLHGRFWVDGALDASERARVRHNLDRTSSPPAGEHRVVRVARDGRLWVREPRVTGNGHRTWTILTSEGKAAAVIDLPLRFDPHDVGTSEITGRWIGEGDVHFVRTYTFDRTDSTALPPAWLSESAFPTDDEAAPSDEEFMTRIRDAIRRMASAQEIHYSTHYTYSAAIDSLSWERPEGVNVDIVTADRRGWVGVFSHPSLEFICGLGYGAAVPPGWPAGGVVCGPPPSTSTDVVG